MLKAIHASEDIVAAQQEAAQVIEKLRGSTAIRSYSKASILSVFTLAQAIDRTWSGLATTTRRTNGISSRTIMLLFSVATTR